MSNGRTEAITALRKFLVEKFDEDDLKTMVEDVREHLGDHIDYSGTKQVAAGRVVRALEQHGLLGDHFFDVLRTWRPESDTQIAALARALAEARPTDPPPPPPPPPGPGLEWTKSFPGPVQWVLETASRFPAYRPIIGVFLIVIVAGIALTFFDMHLETAAVSCIVGLALVGVSELVFHLKFPAATKKLLAWVITILFCVSLTLIVVWFATSIWLPSREYECFGRVTDGANKPIVGATLQTKGTQGTHCQPVTGPDGRFEIKDCRGKVELDSLSVIVNRGNGCARPVRLWPRPEFTCITVQDGCVVSSRSCVDEIPDASTDACDGRICDGGGESVEDASDSDAVDASDGEAGINNATPDTNSGPHPCDGTELAGLRSMIKGDADNDEKITIISAVPHGLVEYQYLGQNQSYSSSPYNCSHK